MGYLRRGVTDLLGGGPSRSLKWRGDWSGLLGYSPTVIDLADGKVPSVLSYVPITTIPMTVDGSMYNTTATTDPGSASLATTNNSTTFIGIRGTWGNGPFTATLDGVAFPARRTQANGSYTNSTLFAAKNVPAGAHTATFTGGLHPNLAWTSLIALTGVDPETATYSGNTTATFSVALPAGGAGYVLLYTQVNGGTHPTIITAGGLTWTSLGSANYDGENSSAWWIASYTEAQAGGTISLQTSLDIYGHNQVAVFPQTGSTGANPFTVVADSAAPGLTNALQSADIADGEVASATLRVTTPSIGGFVEFHRRVSAEAADKAEFLVDGELKYSVGGETPWGREKYSLAPGAHTLVWRFVKNASVSSGLDAMRLAGIRVDAVPSTIYEQGDIVRYRGRTYRALRTNTNTIPVEGPDWTLFSERGVTTGKFAGFWSKERTYIPEDVVQLDGVDYMALAENVNVKPDARVTFPSAGGMYGTYQASYLGSATRYAIEFTPSVDITFNGIEIPMSVTTSPPHRVGFASAINATDGTVTWIDGLSVEVTTEVIAQQFYRYHLSGTLRAGTTVYFAIVGSSSLGMNVFSSAPTYVNGTGGTPMVGTTSFAAASARIPFALLAPRSPAWRVVGPGAVRVSPTGDAVIPADVSDSWVVGSTQMNHDPSDVFGKSQIRAFFNKVTGAFRAGSVSDNRWDSSAQGYYSAAFGNLTRASGSESFAVGYASEAMGHRSLAAGYVGRAVGDMSTALGRETQALGYDSTALGANAVASRSSQIAWAPNQFATPGDMQASQMVLAVQTADATPKLLVANTFGGAVVLTGQYINVLNIPLNRAYKVRIQVVARDTGSGDAAGWFFDGVIARSGSGAARFVAGGLAVSTWADTPAGSWDLTPTINSADETNNYLALTATGEAAKTIRWVANIDWVEVG